MAEYELDIAPIPLGPRAQRMAAQRRVRQQRRMQANALPEPEMVGEGMQPGRGNDSGLSEIDVPRYESQEQIRERLQGLAGDVTQAAGQGLAQSQPEQTPPAPVAQPPAPAQAPQAMPEEDDDEVIGMPGMATPPSTQLRPPMSGQVPQASTPLRAPGVMDDLPPMDEEAGESAAMETGEHTTGAEPDDEMIGTPMQKGSGWDPELQERAAQADTMRGLAAESEDIARARQRARIAATIAAGLGASSEQTAAMMAPYDPQAPYERYQAQQAAQHEQADADWRRQLEERRAAIEDRRIAQAESATESRNRRTSAEYDVDSSDASAMRQAYSATLGNLSADAARLLPGFLTTEYGGQLDLSQQTASGMQSLIDQLNREIARQEELNPRAFRLGRHGGGRARDPRGTLAGLGGGQASRGRDYGGPIGAQAISPEEASQRGTMRPPDEIREARRGMGQDPETGLPMQQGEAPRPRASRPAQPQAQAPGGRPLVDREPTPEELAAMPPAERATAGLIQAYRRANPGTSYQDAVAAVQILQPTERSRIMTDYGSDSVVEVPGWQRTQNVNLAPRELQELRAQNAATDRIIGASRRMEELARQIGPAELARGTFTSDETMSLARNISREMQASMRALQNMGVPNGPEMAMALEQAGEIRTPVDLMRVQATYRALLRWAVEANAGRMSSYGFVRRRQR